MGAPRAIAMFGSDTVKKRYLPPVCAGEDHVAIAISEPEAGSDVPSMRTRVEDRDGDLVLNGEKIWVSGVDEASAAVVWAKFPEWLGTLVIDLGARVSRSASTSPTCPATPDAVLHERRRGAGGERPHGGSGRVQAAVGGAELGASGKRRSL
jgi:hypothetical protein